MISKPYRLQGEDLVWLIGVVICHPAPWVQLLSK